MFATLLPEPPSSDGYWNKPFIGVKRRIAELRQFGVQIQPYTFNQSNSKTFSREAEKILELNPDGVVFAPFFKKESIHFINKLNENKIPFVFIDSDMKDQGQISYVGQDSYQSGLVSGKLLDLMMPEGNILIIHFAKEMDNQNHLVLREKGFYNWFKNNTIHKLFTTEVPDAEKDNWMEEVYEKIQKENIKGIFVTNSKVFYVGKLIERYKLSGMKVIGHDLVKENIEFLNKDIVQFLICQRPEEQGYNAINKLFMRVVEKREIAIKNYTSIDIVTKENVDYYKEFK